MWNMPLTESLCTYLADHSALPIVITGGRGWLGQASLACLELSLGADIANRVWVFGSSDGQILLPSGRVLPCSRLDRLGSLAVESPLLLHFAFLTKEKTDQLSLGAFVEGNTQIRQQIAGAIKRLRPVGVVMPSSGAARTSLPFADNPYGHMKREDEIFFSYLTQSLEIPFSCPRLFNLAGPYINKLSSYALSSIILDVLRQRPIGLRANKLVIRSYVHVWDLLSVCLSDVLLAGQEDRPTIFETAGAECLDVGELAQQVRTILGMPDLPILRPEIDQQIPPDVYVGDRAAWSARLARHGMPERTLSAQITDTATYLQGLENVAIQGVNLADLTTTTSPPL